MFDINNKVALISGGAAGLGLHYAKALLQNGLKSVTIADISEESGLRALQEIQTEFGPKRAIFVPTDVTDRASFEKAFKLTIQTFNNLDILINNAGICNDSIWERQIAINVNGTALGTILALDHYIPKYKSGPGGVIVNISSTAGITSAASFPLYCATKFAIIGMSKGFGDDAHHHRTGVRVLTLCPGVTETRLMKEVSGRTLGPEYQEILDTFIGDIYMQKPESVALAMVEIVRTAKSGTVWVADNDQGPYEYVHPPREDFAPKFILASCTKSDRVFVIQGVFGCLTFGVLAKIFPISG